MAFVYADEPVFYTPPIKPNRILIPGILLVVLIVVIVGFILWRRWRTLEAEKDQPQFECRTSEDCSSGQICSSINTCEIFLAPVQ